MLGATLQAEAIEGMQMDHWVLPGVGHGFAASECGDFEPARFGWARGSGRRYRRPRSSVGRVDDLEQLAAVAGADSRRHTGNPLLLRLRRIVALAGFVSDPRVDFVLQPAH